MSLTRKLDRCFSAWKYFPLALGRQCSRGEKLLCIHNSQHKVHQWLSPQSSVDYKRYGHKGLHNELKDYELKGTGNLCIEVILKSL